MAMEATAPKLQPTTKVTRLRALRLGRGLRQKDLARIAEIGVRTVVAAENATYKPSRATFRKLCSVFNIPFSDRETLLEMVSMAPAPSEEA